MTAGRRLPGVIPSPNIWHHPATYEIENRAVDPDDRIGAAMRAVADWAGKDVLDIGCGSGYHLAGFARTARSVVGVEPYEPLARLAHRRTAGTARVSVRRGTAQALPLPPASVDVAHARWAYFFGPGCEPGLRELSRVMRRGGTAFVVDYDLRRSTFGRWFRVSYPSTDPDRVERFWSSHGWTRMPLDLEWRFASRAELEAVARIELDPRGADGLLAEVPGTSLDVAVHVWWRTF